MEIVWLETFFWLKNDFTLWYFAVSYLQISKEIPQNASCEADPLHIITGVSFTEVYLGCRMFFLPFPFLSPEGLYAYVWVNRR